MPGTYITRTGQIITVPTGTAPPPNTTPVSAPPPAPGAGGAPGAPSGAPGAASSDADYQKWLKSIGLFSGLANTGGQSASDLVAGIVDPTPAPQTAFSGLTPAAAQPQSTPPAAAPQGTPGPDGWTRIGIPGYPGVSYFVDANGNVMTKAQAPGKWTGVLRGRSGILQNPDEPYIQSVDQSSPWEQIDWQAIGMVAAPFTAGYSTAAAPTAAAAPAAEGTAATAVAEGAASQAMPAWASNALKQFGLGMLSTGGDVGAAAKGTAIGAGVGAAADAAAPYVNDAMTSAGSYFADNTAANDELRRQAMGVGPADRVLPSEGMPSGGMLPVSDMMPPAVQPDPSMARMPMAVPEVDPTFGGHLIQSAPGMFTPSSTPSMPPAVLPTDAVPPSPDAAKPAAGVTSQDLQRYAKIGMQLNDLLGAAKGPQQPASDASPEDQQKYYSDVVNYLGLDAKTMADSGLQPGSPEYTQYILDQADTIIAQTMQGLDVNSADLSAQLHTKTDQELQQLQRALFVRGQLGQQMGAGTYVDPATGTPQEVLGRGMFDPSTAAYQRGLAGNVNELAGKQGQGAHDYLTGMLNRHADMFGMQGAADTQFEQAKRNEQNPDELRRRRGMLGG